MSTDTPRLLTVDEAAERLTLTADTVRNLCARNRIGHMRVGDGPRPRIRLTDADIDAYIARRRRGPAPEPPPDDSTPAVQGRRVGRRLVLDLPEAQRYG